MELLYISTSYFFDNREDGYYTMPAYSDKFWKKYLDSFDRIIVVCEPPRKTTDTTKMVKIIDERIKVVVIPENSKPNDWKNDKYIKKVLTSLISQHSAIIIQPASRKGVMAIKIAKRFKKDYILEFTGDLNLSLKSNGSFLRNLYRPFINHKILKAIKSSRFGLYVTNYYLQQIYPIDGLQLGCTDACISRLSDLVLEKRIQKINNINNKTIFRIGLIGTYSNKRKGIDTAIKALSLIKEYDVELHVLGVGNENDRNKWFDYAKEFNFDNKLFFDKPASCTEQVFEWIDSIDINILPSRSEGLPRCIVESNSRACPSITSNVCGLTELISPCWTHKPTDYKALSALLLKMMSNKDYLINEALTNYKKSSDYLEKDLNKKRNDFFNKYKSFIESN